MKIDFGIVVTAVNNAAAGLAGAKRGVDDLGYAADKTSGRLRAIQVVIASIGAAKAIEFGTKFLDAAAQVEKLRQTLGMTIGSLSEAADMIEEIDQKFGGTQIQNLDEHLVRIIDRLTQTGLPIQRSKELADAIGNISIAAGASEETVQRLGAVFTKIAERGNVDMRTVTTQLLEIPVAVNVMARAWGNGEKSVADFVDAVQRGTVTAEEAIAAFVTGTNQRFANMAQLSQRTVGGAINNIKEAWGDSVRFLSRNTLVNDSIVRNLQAVRDKIDQIVQSITSKNVDDFFRSLERISFAAYNAGAALAPIAGVILRFGEAISTVLGAVPPEILTIGFVTYLAFGRVGAAAVTIALMAYDRFFGEVRSKTQGILAYVEGALPLGVIGLLAFGPKGAVVLIGIGAALDAMVTKFAYEVEQIASRGKGSSLTRYVDQGGTAFKGMFEALKNIEWQYKRTDEAASNFNERFAAAGIGNTFSAGLDQAKASLKLFLDDLQKIDPSQTIEPGTKTATEALFMHVTAVERTAEGYRAWRDRAYAVDAALERATLSQSKNNATMEEAAQKARQLSVDLGDSTKTQGFLTEQDRSWEKVRNSITSVRQEFDVLSAKMTGNTLGESVGEINKRYEEMFHRLEALKPLLQDHISKFKNDERAKGTLEEINSLLEQRGRLMSTETDQATTMDEVRRRTLMTEQGLLQSRAAQAQLDLQQKFSGNPLFNILGGTAGGEAMLEVQRQRLQLSQTILQYEQQIQQLEMQRVRASPELREEIDKTIVSYQNLITKTKEAMSGLSAGAKLQQQLWQEVGRALERGVSDALYGVITGTQTLAEVGKNMFNALTRAATDYIAKLLMMKLLGGALGIGGGGGGGGGLFGGLFADGGIFKGNIKPFANGGILAGPTLFGLAGEAGTEAIMPLTRVNGQLGVRSQGGGGGDTYHIAINAIDTQSGVDFIMKNKRTIAAGLQQLSKLNQNNRHMI